MSATVAFRSVRKPDQPGRSILPIEQFTRVYRPITDMSVNPRFGQLTATFWRSRSNRELVEVIEIRQ